MQFISALAQWFFIKFKNSQMSAVQAYQCRVSMETKVIIPLHTVADALKVT